MSVKVKSGAKVACTTGSRRNTINPANSRAHVLRVFSLIASSYPTSHPWTPFSPDGHNGYELRKKVVLTRLREILATYYKVDG